MKYTTKAVIVGGVVVFTVFGIGWVAYSLQRRIHYVTHYKSLVSTQIEKETKHKFEYVENYIQNL